MLILSLFHGNLALYQCKGKILPDYQQMYYKMVRAARDAQELNDKAQQILISAMQECEEIFISEPECKILPFSPKEAPPKD